MLNKCTSVASCTCAHCHYFHVYLKFSMYRFVLQSLLALALPSSLLGCYLRAAGENGAHVTWGTSKCEVVAMAEKYIGQYVSNLSAHLHKFFLMWNNFLV